MDQKQRKSKGNNKNEQMGVISHKQVQDQGKKKNRQVERSL